MQVLLINDNQNLAEVLQRVLELQDKSTTVTCMGDGDEALRLYKARSYDVVLTDLIHPGVSGIDICNEAFTAWQSSE